MANKLYCIAVKSEKQLGADILACAGYLILCPEKYDVKTVKQFLRQITNYKLQITNVGKYQITNYKLQIANEDKSQITKIYLDLPVIAMSKDIKILREILGDGEVREALDGIVANNVYALKLAEEYGLNVFKGMGLNTLNDNFCDFDNIILSPETGEPEYRLFGDWDKKNYFLCVYGRLPLMTLAHCPYQANGYDCKSCENARLQYKDEPGNTMDIRRVRIAGCYFEFLNSVPHNLLNRKNKIKPHFYFDMRETEKDVILKILKMFKEPGNKEPEGKHTAGLYFKNVK